MKKLTVRQMLAALSAIEEALRSPHVQYREALERTATKLRDGIDQALNARDRKENTHGSTQG